MYHLQDEFHGTIVDLADALLQRLSFGGDVERARQELTLPQLDVLDLKVRALSSSIRSARNALAPIHLLPREILAIIFQMLKPDYLDFPLELQTSPDPYIWMKVSHVCRFWRDTAMLYSTLWSTIDSAHPLAALACLDRSRDANLRVHLRDKVAYKRLAPSMERGGFTRSIAPHSSRFEEFHMVPLFRYDLSILNPFRYPAPELKALTIALDLSTNDHILPTIFDGHTPKLTKLTLSSFTSWPGNQFNGLTHLCLYNQMPEHRPSMSEFLQFLEGCPDMEELVLVDAGPSSLDRDTSLVDGPSYPHVHLDKLRLLDVGHWTSSVVVREFLSHISIPSSTKVFVWGDVLFADNEAGLAMFPRGISQFGALKALKSIHLSSHSSGGHPTHLVIVEDNALFIHRPRWEDTFIQALFQTLDVDGVETLTWDVERDDPLGYEQWIFIYRKLPHLKHLVVHGRASQLSTFALGRASEDGTMQPLCRQLTTLAIFGPEELQPSDLYSLSEYRAEKNTPLRRLTIGPTHQYRMSRGFEYYQTSLQLHVDEVVLMQYPHHCQNFPDGWPTDGYKWCSTRGSRRV